MPNFRSNRYYNTIYIQPTPNEVGLSDIYTQPGHGLEPGTAVYLDSASGNLLPAIASSLEKSTVLGIVESVNGSQVTVVYQGEVTFPTGATSNVTKFPLVTGNTYYLSASVTGGITGGYNTSISSIIKPLLIPVSGYQGVIVNSLPLSTAPLVSLFTPVGSIVPYVGGGSNLPEGWLLCAGDALSKSSQDPPYTNLYDIIGEKYGILGISVASTTGNTAYIRFDGKVDDAPAAGPGSTKNHSIVNNDVFKLVWGENQAVVQAYSATGTTHNVTFKYLASITGASSFNSLGSGTEITLKSLVNGEASGYTSDKFFLPDLRGRMAIGAGQGRGLSNRTTGVFGGEETHTLTNSEIPSHSHAIPLLDSVGISGSASYLLNITGGVGTSIATLSSFAQAQSAMSSATGGADDHENMPPFLTTNWIIRYRSNKGQPGIEVGPQGKAGVTGAQGIAGPTGAKGATGSTGAGMGALCYTYTGVVNIPPGYLSRYTSASVDMSTGMPVVTFSQHLVLSGDEYYGADVGSYIAGVMSNNNSQSQATAIVRSMRDPSAFFGVYTLRNPYTLVSATGPDAILTPETDTPAPVAQYDPAAGIRYYRLPIKQTLSQQGGFTEGEMYSVLLVPSARDGTNGVNGATGATGPRGATGSSVNVGLLTFYYAGDGLLDIGISGSPQFGYFTQLGSEDWIFSFKDYFGNDASNYLTQIGQNNRYTDSQGNTRVKNPNGVQLNIRSLYNNSYNNTFYLNGRYATVGNFGDPTYGYQLERGTALGTTAPGSQGGLVSGHLYGIHMVPLPTSKDGSKEGNGETVIVVTDDTGIDADGAVADDGVVVSELAGEDPQGFTQPYGASKKFDEPTSGPSLFNALQGSYSQRRFTSLSNYPVWAQLEVKNNFNYNVSLTSQPCNGNCDPGEGYVSLCNIVRDVEYGNYYTPPKNTNIALVPINANTKIDSNLTQVVDGCSVNIYGTTGSYFTKIPVGISANYMDTGGETGRNTLVMDIYMNTNNIAVGNFVAIRPEYFNLSITGSATGHQTLAGVYKVDSVTGDSVRVYTPVPFGASGSSIFTGYVTGGISGDFNRVDVYTLSVNFQDCSGYIVSSGELTLGLSAYGLPFVISFEGTTSDSQTAKAVSAVNSGFVEIGEGMAFYGWPSYGAALYATTSGNIKASETFVSKCGHGLVAKDGGVIDAISPILSSNTYAMFTKSGGSVHIENKRTTPAFTTIANNAVMGVLDSGTIEILDSKQNLLSNRFQTGFYFSGNSSFSARGDRTDSGLTGATGLSSVFTGSTGSPTGPSGGTGGSSFFIVGPVSSGEVELVFAKGVIAAGSSGGAQLRASAPAVTGPNKQVYTSSVVPGSKNPEFGFPRFPGVFLPQQGQQAL